MTAPCLFPSGRDAIFYNQYLREVSLSGGEKERGASDILYHCVGGLKPNGGQGLDPSACEIADYCSTQTHIAGRLEEGSS